MSSPKPWLEPAAEEPVLAHGQAGRIRLDRTKTRIRAGAVAGWCMAVLLLPAALGQQFQFGSDEPFSYSKRVLDKVSAQYGITQVLSPERYAGPPPASDLTGVYTWLAQKYPDDRRPVKQPAPLRELTNSYAIIIDENERYRRYYEVSVRISLRDGPEEAGRAAASYLAGIAVTFERGSFSGSPVGDWTASRASEAHGGYLVFLRGNAFVQVGYQGPYEDLHSDGSRRLQRDASLKQRCEELAREIDEQIQRLPAGPKKDER